MIISGSWLLKFSTSGEQVLRLPNGSRIIYFMYCFILINLSTLVSIIVDWCLVMSSDGDASAVADAVIYAIDSSLVMFQSGVVRQSLDAVCDSMRRTIPTNSQTQFCIFLYNCLVEQEGEKVAGISTILRLSRPNPQDVRHVLVLSQDDVELGKVVEPAKNPVKTPIYQVFSTVQSEFQQGLNQRKLSTMSRKFVIITNDDEPHDPRSSAGRVARAKSQDLTGIGIQVIPIFIGEGFRPQLFWQDLHYLPPGQRLPIEEYCKPVDDVHLKAVLLSKTHPKRAVARLHIELGHLRFPVRGYNLIYPKKKPLAVKAWVDGEEVHEVETKTSYLDVNSGEELGNADLSYEFTFSGCGVPVSGDELSELRHFEEPVVRILGFCPWPKQYFKVRPPLFLYPDGQGMQAAGTLRQSLISKSRVAVVYYVHRGTPFLAYMYPATNPDGFWVTFLPHTDDLRELPQKYTEQVCAPPDLIKKAHSITSNLNLGQFDPKRYPNPQIADITASLESIALSLPEPEDINDKTIPKYRSIAKRDGKAISLFNESLREAYDDWYRSILSVKEIEPPREDVVIQPMKKRRLVNSIEDAYLYFEQDRLNELYKSDLVALLEQFEIKIPPRATKHDLAALLSQQFSHAVKKSSTS